MEQLESRRVLASDFGDAPEPFPVTLSDNGARHETVGPRLGFGRDSETNGSASQNANSDGADEDGVRFGVVRPGQLNATVIVNVQNAPNGGLLNAWIDFNTDGNWGGSEERIFANQVVVAGDNILKFDVPSWTPSTELVARFRLSTSEIETVTGAAPDGEVEDHLVSVEPPVASTRAFSDRTIILTQGNWITRTLDIDQDGDVDFFGEIFQLGKGFWAEQTASGTFTMHQFDQRLIEASDIDFDGDIDFIATNTTQTDLVILKNRGNQVFDVEPLGLTLTGARYLAPDRSGVGRVADFDGDGDFDIAMTVAKSADPIDEMHLIEQLDNGWTSHVITTNNARGLYDCHFVDLDRDGDLDITYATYDNPDLGRVGWYRNEGGFNFTQLHWTTTWGQATSAFPVDYDKDGDLDVLATGPSDLGDELDVFRNDNNGTFTRIIPQSQVTPYLHGGSSAVPADLTGDGNFDVVWSDWWGTAVGWMPHSTSTPYQFNRLTSFGVNGTFAWADDVNNDGSIDILVSNGDSSTNGLIYLISNQGYVTLDDLADITMETSAQVTLSGIGSNRPGGSTLRITATSSNPELIPSPTVNYNSPNTSGTLSLTRNGSSGGSVLITVTVEDAGSDGNINTLTDNITFRRDFTVTVEGNAPPTLNGLPNVTVDENAGQQTVNLSGISAGAGESQPLRVTATSSNTTLIPNPSVSYTSPNATGNIKFTPAANQYGTARITVTVEDGGLDGNLGTDADNATFSRSFWVTVNEVNAPPTLNALPNMTLDENAAQQTVNLSGISAGPGESQPLRVTATSSDTNLIPNPSVTYTSPNATGNIKFTPTANQSGTARITVTVEDGGLDGSLGTAADNATFSRSFWVTVDEVNASPTLDALTDLTLDENAGQQTVNLTGISAGPGESQPLRVTATSSNTNLIPNPSVTYTSPNATGNIKFTPAANQNGTTTITVTVEDGGLDSHLGTGADNATFSRSFLVTVNAVNAPPTLDDLSNLTLQQNAGQQTVSLTGISAGPGESQPLRVTATSNNTSLIPNPTVTYTSPNATGSIAFTPVSNQVGTAIISVTVEDAGEDGQLSTTSDNATVTKTFTVTVSLANFAEVGRTLELRPQQANQRVQSRATASGYQFTLSSGVWSGINSSRVGGNGTSVLTVTTAGRDYFNTIKIDDFAANVGVDFVDSGIQRYSEIFLINLDRLDAGSINFTGKTRFLGNFPLQAVTTRQIVVSGTNTVVSTVDGNLLLWSNQQAERRADVAQAISVLNATVEVLGTGELSIVGGAGGSVNDAGGHKYGVQIVNAKVSGGIAGSFATVTGVAGTSTGDYNHGVLLWDNLTGSPSPMITSLGGDVTVVGYGGGAGASNQNVGVDIHRGGSISAGGTGSVLVQGVGGATTGNRNFGVQVTWKNNQGQGSRIHASGGDVRVEGYGGGTGTESRDNYGVRVYHHASIYSIASGKLDVVGRGGQTGGIYNMGVFLDGNAGGGEIKSVDGGITVVAQGGGFGDASRNSYGVDVWRGGSIHSSGSGSLSVSGTGAAGAVGNHYGVHVHGISAAGKRSQISSSGGDVNVTGRGGGTGDAASNFGVFVQSNGLIAATGSGNVTVTGTSGQTGGSNQIGVGVNGEFAIAQITSVDGKVTVIGRSLGNGTSDYGEGVELYKGGEISSTGQGEVHVEGSSADGSGGGNRGVFLFDVSNTGQPSRIISAGGKVTVVGTGGQGAGENSWGREGILVKNGARISSPGDIRIIGQGGLGSKSSNVGVFVHRESADGVPSSIISTGGVLEIIGNGGGTGNALYNYGVIAWEGGLIQGAPNAATKIIGTGGTSTGNFNHGVVVQGISPTNVPSTVRSMGGSLEITGTGGGTENALYNYGVVVSQGGLIQGSSSASTGIIGTGGSSAGNWNHGVVVEGVSSTDVPSRIISTSGPLAIEGYGGGTGDSSLNHGVHVGTQAEINGSADAELSVIGRGGGTAGESTRNYGVVVNNGSAIQSPGGGLISVDGKGGSGSAGYNHGVLVTGASPAGDRARIHSEGGNVSVTGQGGGNSDSLWDFGVILFSHGLISSTGSGDVTVTGTSGQTGGNNQLGVGVNGKTAPAQITSVDGKVTVVGQSLGNGTSGSSDGVELTAGGEISSTGTGDVEVRGFGGQGSGWGNRGVLLYGVADSGQPSRIISAGGKISVTGTGGGVAGSGDATGVTLQDGGTISGPAEVNVNGNGGLGTGSSHHGVFVRGESAGGIPSTITSTGGALQVVGVGGGTGSSGNNLGICVWLGGLIQGASNSTTFVQGTGGSSSGARNDGIRIDNISETNRPSTVTSAGGAITVSGQGGGSGSSNDNHGVWVVNGGQISGPAANPLVVSGTGGSPSGNQNMGIHVSATNGDFRSTITSLGGDVTLVGQGGGSGASAFNRGVAIWHGGLVTAGGSGAVSITGTGGNGDGAFNLGVSVIGTNRDARITSSGGDVLVKGFGKGTSKSGNNRGVEVINAGVITAGQAGKVMIEGTGGSGSRGYDHGVLVLGTNATNQPALVTSAGGEIKITGHGGGTGAAGYNYGIYVVDGGHVDGPANTHLVGTGGSTSGKFNNGIRIGASSKPTKVRSTGGLLLLEGTGGGIAESTSSSNNYGVAIVQGAEVSVPRGNGRITLSGRGGPGGGDWNRGVYVVDQAENGSVATVTSNAGEIRIEGVGGQTPTSSGNYGIDIALNARLDSGGDMTLVGFGFDANSPSPYGLLIRNPNTTLRASQQILIDALIGVDNVTTDFSASETAWGGGSWQAEISGLTAETEYDQFDIEGTVELGGISLIGDYNFPEGGSVILINNDGTDPIVGTLYALTEGSGRVNEGDVVSFNGALLKVSYRGGDGNDLELTSLNVPPTLDPIDDLQIEEDSGAQRVDLTGISAGGAESQPLRVTATSSHPELIAQPTVNYAWPEDNGSLDFTPQPGQTGTATITVTVEDGGFDNNLATSVDNATFSRSFVVTVLPMLDFGDAPSTYPVTLAENGARHEPIGPRLGGTRDAEVDGVHSNEAIGDGSDEDGVLFGSIAVGDPMAALNVSLQNAASGRVDAWIDFNRDGKWDASEKILNNVLVEDDLQTLNYALPSGLTEGATFARVRLSSTGGLGPVGFATDGEVEDYHVNIATPPTVAGVAVNGASEQRSAVRNLQVQFDRTVEITDLQAAFQISRSGSSGNVGIAATASVENAKTVVNLTFVPGPLVTAFGSLIDGDYELRIDGSQITYQGVELDGDSDGQSGGNHYFGDESTDNFFRKYGDMNGNHAVDLLDFAEFRRMFGSSAGGDTFDSSLDADGDNSIGLLDFAAFRRNFGT